MKMRILNLGFRTELFWEIKDSFIKKMGKREKNGEGGEERADGRRWD